MNAYYNILFQLRLSNDYFTTQPVSPDLLVEPTGNCLALLRKYRLIFKPTSDGAALFYEAKNNTFAPQIPITNETTFSFHLTIRSDDFLRYTTVNNWQEGSVFYVKNTSYQTTGTIPVHSGALSTPLLLKPKNFLQPVDIQTNATTLEIKAENGVTIQTIPVRKKTPDEIALSTPISDTLPISMTGSPDGPYTIRHLKGATIDTTDIYSTNNHTPRCIMIVHIVYKSGAWTILPQKQIYTLQFTSRLITWNYIVHVRPGNSPPILLADLAVKHIDAAPVAFPGTATPPLQKKFTSATPIQLRDSSRQIQLLHAAKILVGALPNPSGTNYQLSAGQLIAEMHITI